LDNERELLLGKRSCYIPNAGHECLSDGRRHSRVIYD